jgi:FkbM family methyltransferase
LRTIFPQEAENDLKQAYLREIDQGYFVEVGANQPEDLSQTFSLEQKGWRGVLIEPQPDLADALRRRRSAKVFAEACTSRSNAGSRMTLHLAGGHSSFDRNLNLADVKPHGATEVPTRTLDQILIDAGARSIDFISIDVEGHELDVLDGFALERWRPRLMLIEDLLLHLRLHRYLTLRNYRWFRRTGINNWYVPEHMLCPLGIDGRWQFLNKFYLGTPFRRARMARRRRNTVSQFVSLK